MSAALPDGRVAIPLSAHTEGLIEQDAAALHAYLERRRHLTDVAAVAASVLRTRRLRRHRAVVRAADRGELTAALGALAGGDEHPLVTRATSQPSGRIAFVFPGQGSQWPSMGVQAYRRLAVYRAHVDTCAAEFGTQGLASPLDYLLADPGRRTNDFSQLQIQGAQFVHGVALAGVWRSCGVAPDVTVGHSLGEIGAAHVAGAITLPMAVGVIAARATLLDTLTGPYRVAVLGVTPEEAHRVIATVSGWVELSVVNSPTSVAISGDADAVEAAVRAVVDGGAFAREIEMWFPAHTTALDPLRADLEALLPDGEFAEAPVQFIGSATADVVPAGTDFAEYWYHNLRSTVRFDRAVGTALRQGATTFVELSAHPALLFAMGDVVDSHPDLAAGATTLVGSGRKDESLPDRLSANVVRVALTDPGYRWADALGERVRPLPDFPFAPMCSEHLWARPEPLPPVPSQVVATEGWEAVDLARLSEHRTAAVLDLGSRELAERLRAALADSVGVTVVEAAAADLLVVVAPALDGSIGELADAVDGGLLRYVDAGTARDLWLVTVCADGASGGRAVPAQAALAAMHRCLGFEHPDRNFRHLDLPADDVELELAVAVLRAADEDVALVAGTVVKRVLTADERPAPALPRAAFDDVVVTGGGGAVGLHMARGLVERGARRVVLLSRRGVEPGVIAELAAGHRVEIVAPRCDVTDPDRVAEVAAEFAGAGASLVVHAAGAATIAPAGELTGAAVRESCAAKVTGLDVVASTWPLRADARLVLCSSVSGLWGGSGHAAYAAANRLLDAAAQRLRAAGRRCTSVRWGLWPGDGVIDAAEIRRVERSGLTAMVPERAVDAALRDHQGDPVVYAAEADRLAVFLGTVPSAVADMPTVGTDDAQAADSEAAVRGALGSVLKLSDTAGLDLGTSLLDLGVDSLLAIDLRGKLATATGRTVPLAVLLGGVTATELIERLDIR